MGASKSILCLASILFAGCATKLEVTYQTDPPGAVIYEAGMRVGYSPVTVVYPVDEAFSAGGCSKLSPIIARWVSGAASQPIRRIACANQGMRQALMIQRPRQPGIEVDEHFALQVERNEIMTQQAAAQRDAATAQMIQALKPMPKPVVVNNIPEPMSNSTRCTKPIAGLPGHHELQVRGGRAGEVDCCGTPS